MARLAQTAGLTEIQQEILSTVKTFVDKEIIPHATALEHADAYPQDIVDGMKEMGLFGLTIPEEYGGLGESLLTYALVVEQIARGWMSVSGVINTHFIVAYMITQHGTAEQKRSTCRRWRWGRCAGRSRCPSPTWAPTSRRSRPRPSQDGDELRHRRRQDVADQRRHVQPDRGAGPHRRGRAEAAPEPHLLPGGEAGRLRRGRARPDRPGKIDKMGYKGVDTTEMVFKGHRVPGERILGGKRGGGFAQMMDGVEVGRVNVAARACGISIRAFELAVEYAQQRSTFGKPIAEHQAIAFKLAEMATKVEAAHLMMVNAARLKDSGERNDVEAGMAKLIACEYCAEVTQESFRIHGGYGYSKEYEIERLMREAPFLLIGEGTSEIQKTIISRGLLREYRSADAPADVDARVDRCTVRYRCDVGPAGHFVRCPALTRWVTGVVPDIATEEAP